MKCIVQLSVVRALFNLLSLCLWYADTVVRFHLFHESEANFVEIVICEE